MQPLSGKGWNEEAEDYSGPRREGHFLQKYNRTFEHLQSKRPEINSQFQRERGLEEEFEVILRTTTTCPAVSKPAGNDARRFLRPKPAFLDTKPKSAGPRPRSVVDAISKTAGNISSFPRPKPAAFKNGLGPRLHFVSLNGYEQQAEDADDVWAESQARIASGEASQYGHNHASSSPGASGSGSSTNVASSFGSANTVVPKALTAKGSAISGKGKSGKRKPDHQSGPCFHYGKGKKGKP